CLNLNPFQIELINRLSSIDDAILIIDDILDDSQIRNGKPCYYKEHGIKNSIITAEILKYETIETLILLAKNSNTSQENIIKILEKFNSFLKNVYLGEKLDLELSKINNFENNLIDKYYQMVTLFTGSHMVCGIEIGLLLQNKSIDLDTKDILTSLGIIRQICDDFDDYFNHHHEPFGDFTSSNNRLPEIIFKKLGGNREQVLNYLKNKNYIEARNLVLNSNIRKELYDYCKIELEKYKKLKSDFNYEELIEDFEKILTKN
ncbi:MAG: polyprenyl synthetase family protein, partial [Nanoarchaeota archaeon]|nr:polyprenyl synthetase family protein [Nanoarchaeota archaeon]